VARRAGIKQAIPAATISTNAVNVKPVVNNAAQSSKAAVTTATTTGAKIKTKTSGAVDANAQKTTMVAGDVSNELKNNADAGVQVKTGTNASVQGQENAVVDKKTVSADINSATAASTGADVKVNGKQVIENAENNTSQVSTATEKKLSATAETAGNVKTKAENEAEANAKVASQTTTSLKPKAKTSVSGKVKTETKVKASGNH
jgi:hypothetical protein